MLKCSMKCSMLANDEHKMKEVNINFLMKERTSSSSRRAIVSMCTNNVFAGGVKRKQTSWLVCKTKCVEQNRSKAQQS